MKYIKINFYETSDTVSFTETDSLNGYRKNKLLRNLVIFFMYIDSDKLEAGKEKFKKDYFKHLDNLKTIIENTL